MRITQGYVSKSVMDFPFHQIYSLDDYNSNTQPCVFFGAYRAEDEFLIDAHSNQDSVVFWTGQDALDNSHAAIYFRNVTALPKVAKYLNDKGHHCELIPPPTFLNTVKPQQLGNKIYAYCPNSSPDYHGKKVIDELRRGGYEITIGDGQWTRQEWRNGKADYFYQDVFVGLCLSEFAGGGSSIIEMGLRGIPVITNVLDLPNCLPWEDAEHVALTIDRLKLYIGDTVEEWADAVWESLDHEHKWLDV